MNSALPGYAKATISILISAGVLPVAMASQDVSSALNLFLRAAQSNSGQRMSDSDCSELRAIAENSDTNFSRFKKEAESFLQVRCGNERRGSLAYEDSIPPQAANPDLQDTVWDGTALCQTADERVLHCEHRGENGRGMFVYAGQSLLENSPSLVCAHFEATYRSPFELEQQVAARCVVTEFDWRYEAQRSDALGIKNWLASRVNHSPLQIPDALKKQCAAVFPDALYCTPTLIVFPESDSTRVGVCQLKTYDRVFGLGALLRIGSWNSRWECESKSTLLPDKDDRLSVEERSCVPDHLGRQMTPFCRFPYMPVARKPLRTYIETR